LNHPAFLRLDFYQANLRFPYDPILHTSID
jgi:hypothetical protein